MSTESVAQAQMKAFWEKNHALKRPLTHFTTYKFVYLVLFAVRMVIQNKMFV